MGTTRRIRPALEDLDRFRQVAVLLGAPEEGSVVDEEQLESKARSFATAAGDLDVGEQALTISIAVIKRDVRVKCGRRVELFKATKGPGVKTLTPKGLAYFFRVRDFLRAHEKLGLIGETPPEPVTVGTYNSLLSSYLPEALADFLGDSDERERHPLRIREYTYPDIIDAVHNREADFAVASVPTKAEEPFIRGKVEVDPFEFSIPRLFICPPRERAKWKRGGDPPDLTGKVFLRLPAQASMPGVTGWLSPAAIGRAELLEMGSFAAILQFVKCGLGVSVVPYLPGEIAYAIKKRLVGALSFERLRSATVAGYLPPGGERKLSPDAKRLYEMVRTFFTTNAPLKLPAWAQ